MKLNILSIHTLRIAGIAIFLYILVLLDWTTFFSLISQVHLRLLGFSILLVFVYLFFRVLRLFLFLRINQKKISLGKCYAICAESMIYAAITPAKVGEVSKLGLLNKQGIHPTLAMLSILIERFFDLFLLLILFLAGAFYYSSAELEIIGPEQIRILGLIAFVTTGFIAFLILSGHVKRIYGYIKKL
ncbi:MAG: lysylphosphatidylglycerol synthase domain-containing protein, partial [Ekhidna sp.]